MDIPSPKVETRLLPLLDIIFILLAFFIIIPQGVPEKKKANVREEKFSSDMKSLSTHRFIYLDSTDEFVRVEYQVLQGNKFIRHKRLIGRDEFIESGKSVPTPLLQIVEVVRSQVKAKDPSRDAMLVIRYEFDSPRFIRTTLVSFAEANQLKYALSPDIPR